MSQHFQRPCFPYWWIVITRWSMGVLTPKNGSIPHLLHHMAHLSIFIPYFHQKPIKPSKIIHGSNTHLNTHYWTGKDISINIKIEMEQWQTPSALLWTGETESSIWASNTSILHHNDKRIKKKVSLGRASMCAPKGERDVYSSINKWGNNEL